MCNEDMYQEDLGLGLQGAMGFDALLDERVQLMRALHPLSAPPQGLGRNSREILDLLPSRTIVDAAVLVGLIPRETGTHVLLTLRTESLRHHGGQVSFPGGRVEEFDGNALTTAMRESYEEIGLDERQMVPLGYLDAFITVSGFKVVPVVVAVDPFFVPVACPGEVAEVFEVPLVYLMQSKNLRTIEIEFQGRPREILEYDWPSHRIWGVTAAMLFNLRERLEQV